MTWKIPLLPKLPKVCNAVALLLQVDPTGRRSGYPPAGQAYFRNELAGTRVEFHTDGLRAGSYTMVVLEHGDLRKVMPKRSSDARVRDNQPLLVVGTFAVNAQEARRPLTQQVENVRPDDLAGLSVAVYPAARSNTDSVQYGPPVAVGVIGFAHQHGTTEAKVGSTTLPIKPQTPQPKPLTD